MYSDSDGARASQGTYDFLPLTISIETLGGISTPFIKRGTPLPAKRIQIFSTASDNQPSVEINVLMGERPLSQDNVSIGKYTLSKITPAKAGAPQIRVTFEVDRRCNVKVQAIDAASGGNVDASIDKSQAKITDELIHRLLAEAQRNRTRDDARRVIAEAELRVRKDQNNGTVTADTHRLEEAISDLGQALMSDNSDVSSVITQQTRRLRALVETKESSTSPTEINDLFASFFKTPSKGTSSAARSTSANKGKDPNRSVAFNDRPKPLTPPASDTPTVALIKDFLEQIDPALESKRAGAWHALHSDLPDSLSQACHSMREVLRLLLDKLAPESQIQSSNWYARPKSGPAVTRSMRIRYALAGASPSVSETSIMFISCMAGTVDAMYAKLSSVSHGDKKPKASSIRMYLNACEAIIGLIASERVR